MRKQLMRQIKEILRSSVGHMPAHEFPCSLPPMFSPAPPSPLVGAATYSAPWQSPEWSDLGPLSLGPLSPRTEGTGACRPVPDQSAPVYITIGDGGNQEGLATNMTVMQPMYSAFREASFGHAIFDIKNQTHAYYAWHRNQDGDKVVADSLWFYNRYWYSVEETSVV